MYTSSSEMACHPEIAMPGSYPPSPVNGQDTATAPGSTLHISTGSEIGHRTVCERSPQRQSVSPLTQSSSRDDSQHTDGLSFSHVLTPTPIRQTTHEAAVDLLNVRSYPALGMLSPQSSSDSREAPALSRLIGRRPTPFPMKEGILAGTVLQPEEVLGRVDSGTKVEKRESNQVRLKASGDQYGTKYHTSPGRMQRPSANLDIEHEPARPQFYSLGRSKGKEIAAQDDVEVEHDKRKASCGVDTNGFSPSTATFDARPQESLSDNTSVFHPGFRTGFSARENAPYSRIRDSPLYKGPPELRHLSGIKRTICVNQQMLREAWPADAEKSESLASQDAPSLRPSHDHGGGAALFPERPTVPSPLHQRTVVSSPSSSFRRLPEYTGNTPSPIPRQRRRMVNRTASPALTRTPPEVHVVVHELEAEEEVVDEDGDEDGESVAGSNHVQRHGADKGVHHVATEKEPAHGQSRGPWHVVKRVRRGIKGAFSGKLNRDDGRGPERSMADGIDGSSKWRRTGCKVKTKIGHFFKKAGRGIRA